MIRFASIALALVAAGCGAQQSAPRSENEDGGPTAIRMRHQIMVRYGEQVQVFEGYMILRGEAFLVKAFAGPGIDLFTVRRNRDRHQEEAHVPGLAERLDLEAVGADIARAYLGGCGVQQLGDTVQCVFFGEPLLETYNLEGRLATRNFPQAHGIGLNVAYEDYSEHAGRLLAGKIELRWGESGNHMVIRLLEARLLDDFNVAQLVIP